jgi:hypothetical protein
MKTKERVHQLAAIPMKDAPLKARKLIWFLSQKYGFCGEIAYHAYACYAIVVEGTIGGSCDKESRMYLESLDD